MMFGGKKDVNGNTSDGLIFGSNFLTTVYIVAGAFEVLQNSCKPHLGFSKLLI
jgi:hypothetical protein